jgi:hypothetical protein
MKRLSIPGGQNSRSLRLNEVTEGSGTLENTTSRPPVLGVDPTGHSSPKGYFRLFVVTRHCLSPALAGPSGSRLARGDFQSLRTLAVPRESGVARASDLHRLGGLSNGANRCAGRSETRHS